MCHCIGERPLKHSLFGHLCHRSVRAEVPCKILQHLMKTSHVLVPIGGWRQCELSTNEERARVPEHARHVANELVWSTDLRSRVEILETVRHATKSLLRPIGESREKMAKHRSLVVHVFNHTRDLLGL